MIDWRAVRDGDRRNDGRVRAWLRPEARRAAGFHAGSGGFFLWSQNLCQFFQAHPAHPVKLQCLPLAFGGLASGPQDQQDRGDERAVNLDRHARRGFGQPVAATQDALDPFEEQFDLPAVTIDQ